MGRPWKLSNFQDPPPPVHLRAKYFHPLDHGRPTLNNLLPHPLQQTMEQQPQRACEQNQNKSKTNSRHIQTDHAFSYSI